MENFIEEYLVTRAEVYSEPSQTSKMKPLCENSSRIQPSYIFDWLSNIPLKSFIKWEILIRLLSKNVNYYFSSMKIDFNSI